MNKVLQVVSVCDRILKLRLILQSYVVTIMSAYAPHTGLTHEQKDHFYHMLLHIATKVDANDCIIIAGNFNWHV